MNASYLIDTNLLVYCFDENAPEKKNRAVKTLDQLGRLPSAALSIQVIAEFSNVALYKLEPPLEPDEVSTQVELYKGVFPVLPLTYNVVIEALRGVRDHSFSYFDAQIWATAKLNQIPVVLSEDFDTGTTIEGVTFANPVSGELEPTDL